MNSIFISKKDHFTLIRTIVYLTIGIAFFIYMMTRSYEKSKVEIGLLALSVSVYMIGVLLAIRTTYTITPDGMLIIHAGLRKIRINSSDIHSAVMQHSYGHFLTAPFASSVDQVKLSYKKNSVIVISPANQREFIHSLQLYNPAIVAETGMYAV